MTMIMMQNADTVENDHDDYASDDVVDDDNNNASDVKMIMM